MIASYWVVPATRIEDLRAAGKKPLGPPPTYENALFALLENYPGRSLEGESAGLYPQLGTFLADHNVPFSEGSRHPLAGELMVAQNALFWVFDHALAVRCLAALGEAPVKLRDLAQHANAYFGERLEATYMKEVFAHFQHALDASTPDELVILHAG